MTYKICYWDTVTNSQKERDATLSETLEIDARKTITKIVPQKVTRRQGLQALFLAGFTIDAIKTAINTALPSPQKELAQIELDAAQDFERTRELVVNMGPLLGLSSDDIDNLFIAADKL